MALIPYDRKISDIFKKDGSYDIDFYQREYKWNKDAVNSLLDDIFSKFDENYNENIEISPENIQKFDWYYLNNFMTNEDRGKTYIVDGQQRLTTLTLVLLKLYHLSKTQNLPTYKYIEEMICSTDRRGNILFKMGFEDRAEVLKDIFDNSLNYLNIPKSISQINMYNNYKYISDKFDKKFSTKHKLDLFIEFLFERILLIEIQIKEQNDVAMVFEVINDRGIPLKSYEILKGKLIGHIDRTVNNDYISIWDKAIDDIAKETEKENSYKEEDIDEFFSFYFRAKYSETDNQYKDLETNVYHKSIFIGKLNEKIGFKKENGYDINHIKKFINNDLKYFAKVYRDYAKSNYQFSSEYDKYKYIFFNGKLNKQNKQLLLLLSAIKFNDEERDKKILEIPKLFDRYYSLLNLFGCYNSNSFTKSVMELNQNIREKTLEEIVEEFDKQLLKDINETLDRDDITEITYDLFKRTNYNSFDGKTFLRYFYGRIEHFISENTTIASDDYNNLVHNNGGIGGYHIEHILGISDENKELFESEDEFNEYRNKLGGLVLLNNRVNISVGNKPYLEKLKGYDGKGTLFTYTLMENFYKNNPNFKDFQKKYNLDFKHYNEFKKSEIEERHQLLFELVKIIWEI